MTAVVEEVIAVVEEVVVDAVNTQTVAADKADKEAVDVVTSRTAEDKEGVVMVSIYKAVSKEDKRVAFSVQMIN